MAESDRRHNDNHSRGYYGPNHGGGRDDQSSECSHDRSPNNARNGPDLYATFAYVYAMGGPRNPSLSPLSIACLVLKCYLDPGRRVDPQVPAFE